MFELQPYHQLMRSQEHYRRLLQEAEEERLYRSTRNGQAPSLPGARVALAAGNLLINLGHWLKRYGMPTQQVGQLMGER